MTQTRTLPWANGVDFRERAMSAVRPGVEALLLAAVALGCAQAAWTVLAPNNAGAVNSTDDQQDASRLLVSDVASPFAPALLDSAGPSHAALALLSGVQVNGVRIAADDPSRSGAILTLNDGSQKAFLIGQEISAGVTLSEVSASYVLVAYPGGTQQLTMASGAQGFSFARAMMGQQQELDAQAPAAPAPEASSFAPVDASPQSAPTPEPAVEPIAASDAAIPLSTVFDAGSLVFAENAATTVDLFASVPAEQEALDGAWLQSMLAHVEAQDGKPAGWRVPASLPEAFAQSGLRAGDLVTSVNGAGPDNLAQVLLGAQSGRFELAIKRGDEIVAITLEADGSL